MYSISLLPYEYKMLDSKERKKNISLLIAIGVMGILFAAYLILTVYASGKTAELNGLRAESAAVEAQIANMGDIKVINDEVGILLKDVMTAAGTSPDWNQLIADIGNSVPEPVSLKSIKLNYQGSSGECIVQGAGSNHQSVSDFLRKLEDNSGIGEIKCKFSSRSDSADDFVEFELSFPILQGPGYKIPLEVNSNE